MNDHIVQVDEHPFAISLAFLWILWPFYGAVLWAVVVAILFMRVCRWLTVSMNGRRTAAALPQKGAEPPVRTELPAAA